MTSQMGLQLRRFAVSLFPQAIVVKLNGEQKGAARAGDAGCRDSHDSYDSEDSHDSNSAGIGLKVVERLTSPCSLRLS